MEPAPVETDTALPAGVGVPEHPYKIFISYLYGKKGKHASRVLNTQFDDLDREENIISVLNWLAQQHQEQNITPIFWKALDG